ncbi:MAG: diguanylate cyclase [Candidatus Aminicenantes bacterium]|nr:diguanylate cyclase [Candidatus Aminicenantes bacterium]
MIKVLIAEDDKTCSTMLEQNLNKWGYDVLKAEDGKKAWKVIQEKEVQIVILDWIMPKMDGLELSKKIRGQKRNTYIYIIMLTIKDQQKDIRTGFASGVDDYITKPFDIHELRARLQTGKRIIGLQEQLLDSQKKLHEIATHDTLTNLLNRYEILNVLQDEFHRSVREQKPISTIMLDIDFFKNINDAYGHDVGDEVLVEVALRLKKILRRYDKVGRYGGDEYLVVLPNCSMRDATRIAERLRRAVSHEKTETAAGKIHVTISVGCASSENESMQNIENLVKSSDKAMYHAKNMGRNCVVAT